MLDTLKTFFFILSLAACLSAQNDRLLCNSLSTISHEHAIQYLRGVQYGWENAVGLMSAEIKRHLPASETDVKFPDLGWANSFSLPRDTSWDLLLGKVAEECEGSPTSELLMIAHRVATRTRQAPNEFSDDDSIRDLGSTRCRDIATLGIPFFAGYRDGFQIMVNSELQTLSSSDDPTMKKSVASLVGTRDKQMAIAMSRQQVFDFCNKTENLNRPLLMAFLAVPEESGPKDRWSTGTLIDTTAEKGLRLWSSSSGMTVEKRNDATYYEIDAGEVIYVAKRTLTKRWDKQIKVTINAPVKFMVDGSSLFLLDEDGKQHKMSVEKKILKKK